MEQDNEITITGNIATYVMPPTSSEILGTCTGTFQFKTYLTPLEEIQAGKELRALLGDLGSQASEKEIDCAFALVQLKYRVIKSPPFWSSTLQDSPYSGNIPDGNIIGMIINKAMRAETMYKELLFNERETILNHAIKKGEELLRKQSGQPEA